MGQNCGFFIYHVFLGQSHFILLSLYFFPKVTTAVLQILKNEKLGLRRVQTTRKEFLAILTPSPCPLSKCPCGLYSAPFNV